MYQTFCQGALDNPDPDEEEPADAWISTAMDEDEIEIPEEEIEEGQFDDA